MGKNTHIEALLFKKQTKELNPDELLVLSKWKNSDDFDPNYERQIISTITILKTDKQLLEKFPYEASSKGIESIKKKRNWIRSIAAFFIVALIGGFFWGYVSQSNATVRIIATNYQKKGTLPDGSTFILNENSEISFPKSFGKQSRRLSLKGQAYFDIHHNNEISFQIELPDQSEIKVLGTQFTVNTRHKKQIETYLIKGSLLWKNFSKKEKLMTSGEALYLHSDTQKWTPIKKESLPTIIEWKNKPFVFKNQTIAEIMLELSAYFNTEITSENTLLKNQKIRGQFSRDISLNEILELLSKASNFKYYNDQSTQTWVLK